MSDKPNLPFHFPLKSQKRNVLFAEYISVSDLTVYVDSVTNADFENLTEFKFKK